MEVPLMEVYLNHLNKKNRWLYGEGVVTAREGSSGLGVLWAAYLPFL
jgi:hypothetical protein